MMQVEVRAFDGNAGGSSMGYIPKATNVSVMEELNGPGSVTFTAAASSPGVADLQAAYEAMVTVTVDGVPIDAWGMIDTDSDDLTDAAADARPVTFAGPGIRQVLADAVIGLRDMTSPTVSFADQTPGYILQLLNNEARTRGATMEIFRAFNLSVPTNPMGPWANSDVTRSYSSTSTLLDVLTGLIDDGLIDSRMSGADWQAFNKDDSVTGLNRLREDIRLSANWYRTAQRNKSRAYLTRAVAARTSATYNDIGVYGPPLSSYRRIETYLPLPGLTLGKAPYLGLFISRALDNGRFMRRPSTVSYLVADGRPMPWVDYRIGDRIYADGFGSDPVRVRSMTATQLESGATEITLELNDVQTELDLANATAIDKITRGVA